MLGSSMSVGILLLCLLGVSHAATYSHQCGKTSNVTKYPFQWNQSEKLDLCEPDRVVFAYFPAVDCSGSPSFWHLNALPQNGGSVNLTEGHCDSSHLAQVDEHGVLFKTLQRDGPNCQVLVDTTFVSDKFIFGKCLSIWVSGSLETELGAGKMPGKTSKHGKRGEKNENFDENLEENWGEIESLLDEDTGLYSTSSSYIDEETQQLVHIQLPGLVSEELSKEHRQHLAALLSTSSLRDTIRDRTSARPAGNVVHDGAIGRSFRDGDSKREAMGEGRPLNIDPSYLGLFDFLGLIVLPDANATYVAPQPALSDVGHRGPTRQGPQYCDLTLDDRCLFPDGSEAVLWYEPVFTDSSRTPAWTCGKNVSMPARAITSLLGACYRSSWASDAHPGAYYSIRCEEDPHTYTLQFYYGNTCTGPIVHEESHRVVCSSDVPVETFYCTQRPSSSAGEARKDILKYNIEHQNQPSLASSPMPSIMALIAISAVILISMF